MSAWAKPGVKCVCVVRPEVIRAAQARFPWAQFPQAGGTYTIRDFVYGADGVARIRLREIQNRAHESKVGIVEWGFPIAGFRPLITKTEEQDIALFRQLLAGLPIGEPV